MALSADGTIEKGVVIDLMTKLFKQMSKSGFEKLDDFDGYAVLMSDTPKNVHFEGDNVKSFVLSKKKTAFLFKFGDLLELTLSDDKKLYVGMMVDGEVVSSVDREIVEKKIGFNKDMYEKQASINPSYAAAVEWLLNGRTGTSSMTMCALIFPDLVHPKLDELREYGYAHPYDSSDFNRCVEFLKAVPDARNHLGVVGKQSKEWAGLIKNWDRLEASLLEEKEQSEGRTPKTYNAIKEIINDGKPRVKLIA